MIQKKGYPAEGELLICTVDRILHNAVFVFIDMYGKKEAMIRLPEIAPGRIRNLRDYVKEGKRIVCKVLRVDASRDYIELSLRRVSGNMQRKVLEEEKLDLKSEKIIDFVAGKLKVNSDDLKNKLVKCMEDYGYLNKCFQDVAINGERVLTDIGLDSKTSKELAAVIKDRIKPAKVSKEVVIKAFSYAPDGVEKVKEVFKKVLEASSKNNYAVKLSYMGAPRYRLRAEAGDYKAVEKILEELSKIAVDGMKKAGGSAEIVK